jgi:hypothetical protein
MIQLSSFLNEIVSKKKKIDSISKDLVTVSYVLCKEFGWDYYTLKKQPIPFILTMVIERNEAIKRENKAIKKR